MRKEYKRSEEKNKNSQGSNLSKEYKENEVKLVKLFELVKKSGKYNFQECRIPVPGSGKFNMNLWREKLAGYKDKVICDYLEFGFPLDFNKTVELDYSNRRNHKGARDFPEFIDSYLKKECDNTRIAGPFETNPLSSPIVISPLNSVPKSGTDDRRVIVDLSWPHGKAVNDGISKNLYLGEEFELHYTSVERICSLVRKIGPGALIYKRDLKQAYRQFPVDPSDYCYLGYFWKDMLYFDSVLCMGQRNAGMACARSTDAVMYIHREDGHEGESYLDDLIGVSPPAFGMEAYQALGKLLADLGLLENFSKACPPETVQLVLGVIIDTVAGTISVPNEKMVEINDSLRVWKNKRKATKNEIQSIIGVLQFVSKCVRQSRVFMNRLLEMLRSYHDSDGKKILTESFRKDINWWWNFMEKFNGVSYIPQELWDEPDVQFSTDSCLTGCGGIFSTEFFHAEFPEEIRGKPIHQLEMLAILIGVRFWGKYCSRGKIQIFCDNEACVRVINSSRTRDPFLATCLREIWLEVSLFGFELRAVHLPGVDNRVADWLSRWDLSETYRNQFYNFIGDEVDSYNELHVEIDMFKFSSDL